MAAESVDVSCILGRHEREAMHFLEKNGYILRVRHRDGEPVRNHDEHLCNRISVSVQDGIIVQIISV